MASTDITAEITELATLGVTWEQVQATGLRVSEWAGEYTADNSAARYGIARLVSEARDRAARTTTAGPAVTDRQAAYIETLGGTVTPGMTRREASALIDQLKSRTAASAARAAGARHGVSGEIWD